MIRSTKTIALPAQRLRLAGRPGRNSPFWGCAAGFFASTLTQRDHRGNWRGVALQGIEQFPFLHRPHMHGASAAGRLMRSAHSARYRQFLERLRAARRQAGLTQIEVSRTLRKPQSFVSKCESGERRVDVIELCDFARIYRKAISFFLR